MYSYMKVQLHALNMDNKKDINKMSALNIFIGKKNTTKKLVFWNEHLQHYHVTTSLWWQDCEDKVGVHSYSSWLVFAMKKF